MKQNDHDTGANPPALGKEKRGKQMGEETGKGYFCLPTIPNASPLLLVLSSTHASFKAQLRKISSARPFNSECILPLPFI